MPAPSRPFPPRRSFQWDLARQVERLDWLLAQLPRYADWGYNELHLHLEDAVEYPRLPAVARRDAYSYKQFARLVDAATRHGIGVVPIVNLLGHTQYLIKVPELRDLNELRAPDGSPLPAGQICPLHPRTLEVAEKLLRDMAPFCTTGKVHLGLDESFHLGRHPLSRREIADVGLATHFARHVQRLHAVAASLGLRSAMWADMLYFLPDAIPQLPADLTAYEWFYHAFRRWPRVELFNFAETDIATPLRARGLSLYGCPMNGAARYEPLPSFTDRMANILAWGAHTRRLGAEGLLVTSWEPFRLAIELTTAVDAAAAGLWLTPEITDPRELLARGFERRFGRAVGRRAARVAVASDRYLFAGYPRWEFNERWDVASRREPLAPYRTEERFFARAVRDSAALPIPLRASLVFRHYLAARDVFVRRAARGLATSAEARTFAAQLRRARTAARLIWARTRDRRVLSHNERILAADAARLSAWRRAEPVFGGAWQLCYCVWNFAPSLHLVAVEQCQPDGTWRELQACYTVEFQNAAAQPRSTFIREHAAPIAWDGDLAAPPQLRFTLRGVGQVKIGAVELRRSTPAPALALRPREFSSPQRWRILGEPAPRRGLPDIDWSIIRAALPLSWSSSPASAPARRSSGS
ncbi:family 20 glycosylhydrolase [Horticoccus luteus]|uniref:Family 20 glycosylhydrolase n=1 Tax=Horticoccus luteus TaxID=2862869 RepID=A0A8F9TUJ3_9BACT|nr:family 20 glycosylhydrolase [Horticoccus luteus]QYM79320.1 family 20 glycosylhydrolase [Horticoccus luteus]